MRHGEREAGRSSELSPLHRTLSTPRTKNRCMVMTMMSGSRIEMKVAAIMSVSPWPLDCTMPVVITVSGELRSLPPRKINGISRSFQDHRNCMIASEASTGRDSGRAIAVKVRRMKNTMTNSSSLRRPQCG